MSIVALCINFVSCETVDTNITLSRNYTLKVKKYFIACSYDNDNTRILKWNKKEVSYSIKGFNQKHTNFIHAVFQNLQYIKNLPKFSYRQSGGDVTFYMPETEKEFIDNQQFNGNIRGYINFRNGFSGYFSKVRIHVKPTNTDDLTIQITLQHEILHALGLAADPIQKLNESSALGRRFFSYSDPWDKISPVYPQIDIACLKLLYDSLIPIKERKPYIEKLLGIK